jgi:Cu-Zn family superoxide dismutase
MRTARIAASMAALGGLMLAAIVLAPASARDRHLQASLVDPAGNRVGTVTFTITPTETIVNARFAPTSYVAPAAFHGFHIHANRDHTNGDGCLADPAAASGTWFVAVDGHLSQPGQTHGHHSGDMPSPLVQADGSARLRFTTDRLDPDDLVGRAVVLHAGPDNFGNVPTGTAPDQYTPNSPSATDTTLRTGNAGDRVACGIITD